MPLPKRRRSAPAVFEPLMPRMLLSADPGWTGVYASTNYSIGPAPIAFYANHANKPALNGSTVRFILSSDTQVGNADDVVLASSPYATSADAVSATLPDLAPGTYHFFATCDNAHPISAGDLTVYPNPDGVDLAPAPDPAFFFGLPSAFPAGEFHGVNAPVMNLGKTAANNVSVALYLSPTPTLGPDAYLVQKRTVFGNGIGGIDARGTASSVFMADFPYPMPNGTYYPIFVIDPDNQIAEANESNNTRVGDPITIVPPSANITLLSISTADTATINPNSWTTPVPMDVTFSSSGSPQNFRLILYLSADDVAGNADDVPVGYTGYFDTPTPGSTTTVHTTVSYSFYGQPTPFVPGTYHLVAKTDTPPDVTPADNIIVGPEITLVAATPYYPPPPPPPVTPDLTLGPIAVGTPDQVYPGSRIYANAEARTSTSPTTAVPDVRYVLSADDVAGNDDDILLTTRRQWATPSPSDAGLENPYYANMTIPSSVAPGTYHVLAIIDPENTIAETDETNNAVVGPTITVGVAPPVDLTPGPVTSTYVPIYPGYYIGLSGGPVTNAPVSQPVKTAYYLSADDVIGNEDDILLGTTQGDPVEAGWSGGGQWGMWLSPGIIILGQPFTVPASVAPGTYHVISVIDPDNAVAEADETNNATLGPEVTVSAIPPLDLTVSGTPIVTAPLGGYRPGSNLNLWANAESTAPLPDPVKLSFYLSPDDVAGNDDDILIGSYTRNARFAEGYPPGAMFYSQIIALDPFTIPSSVKAGTYHVIAVVDPDNQFAEADETNNSVVGGTITIEDTPQPTPAPTVPTPAIPTGGEDPDGSPAITPTDGPASGPTTRLRPASGRRMTTGSTGWASLTVKHQPAAALATRYNVKFYLSSDPVLSADDVPFSHQTVSTKARGKHAATLTLKYTLPDQAESGTQYLIAVADPVVKTSLNAPTIHKAAADATRDARSGRIRALVRVTVAAPQPAAAIRSVRPVAGRPNRSLVTVRVTNTGPDLLTSPAATIRLLRGNNTVLLTTHKTLNLPAHGHQDLQFVLHRKVPANVRATVEL